MKEKTIQSILLGAVAVILIFIVVAFMTVVFNQ